VDDESPAIEVLRSYIGMVPQLQVAGVCYHGVEAFHFLQQHPVDLMFLDIQMPKLSGTELIRALASQPKIIFTTAHREFAWDGFELNAVDFLLKPIPFNRFLKAIQKALPQEASLPVHDKEEKPYSNNRFLYFRVDRKQVKVMVDDIEFAESLKDYLKISFRGHTLITKQTISSLQEMLPATDFARVHRSFIVSLKKVTSFDSHQVFVGNHAIPLGSMYRAEVMKLLTAPSA